MRERVAPLTRRFLGIPWVFAVAYSAVGFSIYFSLGIVAERGLGLTPLIFLGVGVVFMLNTLTYVEGAGMYRERGGSAALASHAFNDLVGFVAGWAILLDYMIVVALAAISFPHYLTPISDSFADPPLEIAGAAAVIVAVGAMNIAGFTGRRRQRALTLVALAGVALLLIVIAAGAIVAFDPGALTAELDLFTTPTLEDLVYAGVVGTVAYAGIEAASDLTPDLEFEPVDLRRLVGAGAALVPLIYTGVAVIALMAVPVAASPDGPQTQLGDRFIENPVLGVVMSFEPAWLADAMQWAVVAIAPAVLLWAASTSMLGLSRHVYVLATNRQIPSWLGKLGRRWATPHRAIAAASVVAFALVLPADVVFLGGLFAFGGTIAFTIAHLSVIRLRVMEGERERPFRVPFDVRVGGQRLPLPAIVAAVLTVLAWVSVVVLHEGARYMGAAWMVLGLGAYALYRLGFERISLTQHVTVPEHALIKEVGEAEYGRILVPVFGTDLDDDIVSTAGRLADAADEPGEAAPALDVIYVLELPLTVPLDAPPPEERVAVAEAALERAREVAEEYETVEVGTSVVRARSVGSGIVEEARRRGVEMIVMGAEPPTKVRGGALIGGVRGIRPAEVGEVTEYVLKKAPCRVLITAPPEERGPGA